MKISDEIVHDVAADELSEMFDSYSPTAIELLNELKCRLESYPEPDLDELRAKCDAAIQALSAEPAQGEQWQPIETAPNDELVIVYTPPKTGDDHDTCRIDFDYIDTGIADGYWYKHGEAREHFECVGKPDCWSGGIPYDAPYSHWMPLPAAPTSEVK